MLDQIKGLHHVTAMAAEARINNRFFTRTLGLRRVKKTVNFDAPDVYHLYYADEVGSPGTVMTYFPFPHIRRGRPGVGEVGTTAFSVPEGSLDYWSKRLAAEGVKGLTRESLLGEQRLRFEGPDGDGLVLVETRDDGRAPWTAGGVIEEHAIRGFHSVSMRLRDAAGTKELLKFMGYEEMDSEGNVTRLRLPNGNGADVVDLETHRDMPFAEQGAGSVHHVAFAVENRERQAEVRQALLGAGQQVTPVIDRDYFYAIYFRTRGGVLFEIATNEPGFERDEDRAHLGEALKLPSQHAHLRPKLEEQLQPLED